jgi:hypothetical protein
MATRQIASTTATGFGTPVIMAALAVLAGLVITVVVAGTIVFSPAPSSGTYTLSELDDWGTRHRVTVPVDLGPLPDYPLRHP